MTSVYVTYSVPITVRVDLDDDDPSNDDVWKVVIEDECLDGPHSILDETMSNDITDSGVGDRVSQVLDNVDWPVWSFGW